MFAFSLQEILVDYASVERWFAAVPSSSTYRQNLSVPTGEAKRKKRAVHVDGEEHPYLQPGMNSGMQITVPVTPRVDFDSNVNPETTEISETHEMHQALMTQPSNVVRAAAQTAPEFRKPVSMHDRTVIDKIRHDVCARCTWYLKRGLLKEGNVSLSFIIVFVITFYYQISNRTIKIS